jgi:hypothetical protein
MVSNPCPRGVRITPRPWAMAPLSDQRGETTGGTAYAVAWCRVLRRTRPGNAPVC